MTSSLLTQQCQYEMLRSRISFLSAVMRLRGVHFRQTVTIVAIAPFSFELELIIHQSGKAFEEA